MTKQPQLFPYEREINYYYSLMLSPDEPAFSYFNLLKKQADAFLGNNSCIKSLPHISLFLFLMNEKHEPEFLSTLKDILSKICSQTLLTKEIQIFDSNRTIFCALEKQDKVHDFKTQIIKELKVALSPSNVNIKTNVKNLHVTIAKGVELKNFAPLLEHLKKIKFIETEFICSKLILMKGNVSSPEKSRIASFTLSK